MNGTAPSSMTRSRKRRASPTAVETSRWVAIGIGLARRKQQRRERGATCSCFMGSRVRGTPDRCGCADQPRARMGPDCSRCYVKPLAAAFTRSASIRQQSRRHEQCAASAGRRPARDHRRLPVRLGRRVGPVLPGGHPCRDRVRLRRHSRRRAGPERQARLLRRPRDLRRPAGGLGTIHLLADLYGTTLLTAHVSEASLRPLSCLLIR